VIRCTDAIEHGRNLVPTVDARQQQQAHFVDESRLEEAAVDLAATFEKQVLTAKRSASSSTAFTRSTDVAPETM
jgi:hypothetical protein